MFAQFFFFFNEPTFSACANVKTLISLRKALGQNKGYLSKILKALLITI